MRTSFSTILKGQMWTYDFSTMMTEQDGLMMTTTRKMTKRLRDFEGSMRFKETIKYMYNKIGALAINN